jgi:hypothetical protein
VGFVGCSTPTGGTDAGVKDSGSNNNNNNHDAGQNQTPVDAGQIDPNAIGGSCILNGTTCDNGLSCYAVSDQNMCSQVCSQDSDCASGEINNMPGICNGGICFPSCNSNAANPCERSDFACLPYTSTTSICLPNCAQQAEKSFCNDFFGYPFTQCSQTDGSCFDETTCSSTMACPSGQACYTVGSGSQSESLCVNSCAGTPSGSCSSNTDCPLSACVNGTCANCPFGFGCDSAGDIDGGTLNACSPTLVGDYALCQAQAQCTQPSDPSLAEYCVAFQQPPDAGPPTANICMQTCNKTSDCPAHETCTINLGSVTVCGYACSAAGVTCPTGTTCQSLGSLGKYCAP